MSAGRVLVVDVGTSSVRAGIVGADGATHAGLFDIPFLRCVPNVSVACPADEDECRKLLTTAYQQDHAVAVRYPRGAGVGRAIEAGLQTLPFGFFCKR